MILRQVRRAHVSRLPWTPPTLLTAPSLHPGISCVRLTSQIIHPTSPPAAARIQPVPDAAIGTAEADTTDKQRTEDTSAVAMLFRVTRRVLMYIVLGTPILLFTVPFWLLHKLGLSTRIEDVSWRYLVWCMEVLGPTFIKYGQWASTRRDLFPALLIQKLSRLQDGTSVHSWAATKRILHEALGADWSTKLELEPEPIGSGCVAQVHRGRTRCAGEQVEVAVKLLHPGVRDTIVADMAILKTLAGWCEMIPRLHYLSIHDTIIQFEEVMLQQLDLRNEAKNLLCFCDHFKDSLHVSFPHPVSGMMHKEMLVETYEAGVPLSQIMTQDDKKLKKTCGQIGSQMVLKMIFSDRFVHADLHPGNILVDVQDAENVKFTVLDAGLVTRVTVAEGKAMADIAIKMLRHQGYAAGEMMLDHAKEQRCDDADAFCKGVEYIVDHSFDDTDEYSSFGTYLMQVCGLACNHRVKVDPKYLSVAMALKTLEGSACTLDPELTIVGEAIPVVLKAQAKYAAEQLFGGNGSTNDS